MNGKVLGIDLGGTSIKAGIVSQTGKIDHITRKPVVSSMTNDEILKSFYEIIDNFLLNYPDLRNAGIGSPGPIDIEKGIIKKSANLRKIKNLKIIENLKKRYKKIDFYLDNDASCAALGEKYFGLGKGVEDFAVITLGTGVGGGLVINDKLFRGYKGNAFEIGHLPAYNKDLFEKNIPLFQCGCGLTGCLETMASATGVEKYFSYFSTGGLGPKKNKKTFSAFEIYQTAKKKDKYALKTFEIAGVSLGLMISNLITLLNLRLIIITGGMSSASKYLESHINKTVEKYTFKEVKKICKIKFTKGDEGSGIKGAAALCFERL
ncbi:MAG: ROK family protein [Spirochaetia bacterium]|nr:ROK family protein [Spirochaetia bacterium]